MIIFRRMRLPLTRVGHTEDLDRLNQFENIYISFTSFNLQTYAMASNENRTYSSQESVRNYLANHQRRLNSSVRIMLWHPTRPRGRETQFVVWIYLNPRLIILQVYDMGDGNGLYSNPIEVITSFILPIHCLFYYGIFSRIILLLVNFLTRFEADAIWTNIHFLRRMILPLLPWNAEEAGRYLFQDFFLSFCLIPLGVT